MKRLYYLADTVSGVLGITRDLADAGIGENRMHVMGRDVAALEEARVHTTTPWEETEIMPSGFSGAITGLVVGLLAGFALAGLDPWGVELGGGVIAASAAFFTCFGAWLGGIFGISSSNHHLRPYLDKVRQGFYLVMVEVDDEPQENRVRHVMNRHRHEADLAGYEDHFSPFT